MQEKANNGDLSGTTNPNIVNTEIETQTTISDEKVIVKDAVTVKMPKDSEKVDSRTKFLRRILSQKNTKANKSTNLLSRLKNLFGRITKTLSSFFTRQKNTEKKLLTESNSTKKPVESNSAPVDTTPLETKKEQTSDKT